MYKLIAFLYRNQVTLFFLILETLGLWLWVKSDQYANAYFFNSSNYVAGQVNLNVSRTKRYFDLENTNNALANENALLRKQLANITLKPILSKEKDSTWTIIEAKIINNSTLKSENYFTLDKGSKHGVLPGMGVISPEGILGVVKTTSGNFATVTSLLHKQLMVSAQLKKSNTLCTVQWDGLSPVSSNALFIPRHINVSVGDTIVTSGYNAIFPAGIPIGYVSEANLPLSSPFYKVTITLANDFSSLRYAYVTNNLLKDEKSTLESENNE